MQKNLLPIVANSHGEVKTANSEDGPRIWYQQGRISGSCIFATKNRLSVTWLYKTCPINSGTETPLSENVIMFQI